jgi:hypothetical protein
LRAVSIDMTPIFSGVCRSTDSEAMNIVEVIDEVKGICGDEVKVYTGNGHVRQDVTSQIAVMPLPPFGVTLLWHAFSAMEMCEAHKTMWKTLEVYSDNLLR